MVAFDLKRSESIADALLFLDRAMDEAIEPMSCPKSKKSVLPRTTHVSKVTKQRGVSSEGPSTIVTTPPKSISKFTKEVVGIVSDDLCTSLTIIM